MSDQLIGCLGHDPVGENCYAALFNRESVCPWCVADRVKKGEMVVHKFRGSEGTGGTIPSIHQCLVLTIR